MQHFKENSKDIRNTKVLDLFKNLKRKINHIDIYDPIVDAKEIFKEHQVIVKNQINKKKFYDALILAVPHEKIIKDGKHKILSLLKKDAYIIDIKKAL